MGTPGGKATRTLAVSLLRLRLVLADLLDPPLVPTALEVRRQPDVDHAVDHLLPEEIGRHAQDVGVVVPAAHLGLDRVAAAHRPDAVHLVGGDAHAEPGPANQDAAVGLAPGHRLGDRDREVRVVARAVIARHAEVADLVAELGQRAAQPRLDVATPVVTPQRNLPSPSPVISRPTW